MVVVLVRDVTVDVLLEELVLLVVLVPEVLDCVDDVPVVVVVLLVRVLDVDIVLDVLVPLVLVVDGQPFCLFSQHQSFFVFDQPSSQLP